MGGQLLDFYEGPESNEPWGDRIARFGIGLTAAAIASERAGGDSAYSQLHTNPVYGDPDSLGNELEMFEEHCDPNEWRALCAAVGLPQTDDDSGRDADELLEFCLDRARQLLEGHWEAVEAVALRVYEGETVTAEDVTAALNS